MRAFLFFICLSFLTFGCEDDMPKSKLANLEWNVDSVISYGFYGINEMDIISDQDLKAQKFVRIVDSRLSELFNRASFSDQLVLWKG